MTRQRLVTVKTATATLTVSEFGDVIVNSSSAVTITLSAPYKGLWFRVTNVNTGVVSIVYNAVTLATLKQREHFLAFANDITDWYYAKAADLMTKAEIEAVLTGDISSHTHDYAPPPIISSSAPTTSTVGIIGQLYMETTTPTLYYCSAISEGVYTWTELSGGGGTASAFTDLTDVPSSYTGAAGKIVRVNTGATGLEFDDVPVIDVLGLYATLTDLQTAHPTGTAGDAYAVGTATDNVIYIWDTGTSAWVSIGSIKGPQGDAGASGATIWGGM